MRNAEQPAFPKVTPDGDQLQNGLTKREYFAGLAMQGLLASYAGIHTIPNPEILAKKSVQFADALLTELINQ